MNWKEAGAIWLVSVCTTLAAFGAWGLVERALESNKPKPSAFDYLQRTKDGKHIQISIEGAIFQCDAPVQGATEQVLYGCVSFRTMPIEVRLDRDISDTAEEIVLSDGMELEWGRDPIYVAIDAEIAYCVVISSKKLGGCSRGQRGTEAASHAKGARVYKYIISNVSEFLPRRWLPNGKVQEWNGGEWVTLRGNGKP